VNRRREGSDKRQHRQQQATLSRPAAPPATAPPQCGEQKSQVLQGCRGHCAGSVPRNAGGRGLRRAVRLCWIPISRRMTGTTTGRAGRSVLAPVLPLASARVMAASRSPGEVIGRAVSFFARCHSRTGEFPNRRCGWGRKIGRDLGKTGEGGRERTP
jgi:hypothetical protein